MALVTELHDRKILAAGTARANCFKKPMLTPDKELKTKECGYSEQIFSRDGKVCMTKWLDNRCVVLASNFAGVGKEEKVNRWDKTEKAYVDISGPEVIGIYNKTMGGVDKTDMLVSLYRTFIRSRKWTLRMVMHGIDISITNSWLEYKSHAKSLKFPEKDILDPMHFRLRIAETLVKANKKIAQTKRGRPSNGHEATPTPLPKKSAAKRQIPEVQFDNLNHLPAHNGKTEADRCKLQKCKGKTHFLCEKCKVALCITNQKNCLKIFIN